VKLASASINNNDALANIKDTVRMKDTQIDVLVMQLKLLANTVTLLAKSIKPEEENRKPNCGCSHGAHGGQDKQLTKLRNMGGYCWTHGFHPVGVAHDSKNCAYKIEGHCNDATYNNQFKGSTYWPITLHVAREQQNHAAWKDEAKPI
jgi:hypothetical protein